MRSNPGSAVERPREPRRHWRILSPVGIGRVERAFVEERAWREQARIVFLCVVSAGLQAGEVRGLRWHHVSLTDPAGAFLRVRETFVRGQQDTPKSERSMRRLALGDRLADELWQHRRRSRFQGEAARLHRPGRRDVPRGGGAPRGEAVRAEIREK
ncbi:MAG: hypothetical protein ACJ75P_00955 [Gaiellaceae bacterium]